MLTYLTTKEGAGSLKRVVQRYDAEFGTWAEERLYSSLASLCQVPRGLWVFCDAQRMGPEQRALASRIYAVLKAEGSGVRLLNDPGKVLSRYEQLRAFREHGINGFAAYRLAEWEGRARFPVFVRIEKDHDGPRTPLLHTADELREALAFMAMRGFEPESLIVVEFSDSADSSGRFIKYGTFRVGDRIIARHAIPSFDWNTKISNAQYDAAMLQLEQDYIEGNPHADLLMPIFELAGIEYGRIDYAYLDGRISAWEINDNPNWLPRADAYPPGRVEVHLRLLRRCKEALRELAQRVEPGPPFPLSFDPDWVWEAMRDGQTEAELRT